LQNTSVGFSSKKNEGLKTEQPSCCYAPATNGKLHTKLAELDLWENHFAHLKKIRQQKLLEIPNKFCCQASRANENIR